LHLPFDSLIRGPSSNVSLLDEYLLLFLDLLNKVNRHLESSRDNISRGQSEPLRKWDISNTIGLVDLDPNEVIGVAGVLNIVSAKTLAFIPSNTKHHLPRVVRENRSVPSREVKGARVAIASEDCGLRVSLMEVKPLLGSRMPVELSQALWFESHERGSNGLADWEVGRIDFPELSTTAWYILWGVLECAVNERAVTCELLTASHWRGADGAV
jgi:hypothetical protein